uniref:Uncharacterized protein n=1 Tax=Davidia involucrata TaxID=16924 RepID=A0A5B6Z5Z3_DAVIN
MAMDFVVSIAAKIGEYLVAPIGRQLGYLIYYDNNIAGLRNQVEKLKELQVGVQLLVGGAERNGEVILPNVKGWLTRANGFIEDSEKFFNDEVKANQKCFGGWSCPDLKSRHQVSREAKKKTLDVDPFLSEGKFDVVSSPAPPPKLGSTLTKDLEVFESRTSILNQIMKALKDDNVRVIGVYGMGGIGKTTLVQNVAKQAEESKLFDQIVMAVVSQTPNVRQMQGEIADKLGLQFKEETESGRARRISERFKNEKRILVILDDMWTGLNLEDIGIPCGNHHNGCKILLTSRDQDVFNNMNTQINFPIQVLLEEEAWNLFRRMAGNSVDSPDLHPIATKVAKECAGLPIAIVTVATALKNKSYQVWRDALQQFKNSAPKNIKGMHANVYSKLRWSYDFLEGEELKSCFLLCCIFPEDSIIRIEDLVRYGMGLRLFKYIRTLEEARIRVHALVDNLKACCLLLDGMVEGYIRMHDVIRDFGLQLASEGEHALLVRVATGLEEWPEHETSAHHTAIALLQNQFHELPDGLDYPKLNLLLLLDNSHSLKIPDTFFAGMKALRVLDMTHIPIPSLPPSIQCLKNLQTLCLDYCKLREISISLIGELKDKLEILSFWGSDIEELPREIGQLAHLRLLDFTDCEKLKVIPSGVISSLSRLEDLYMRNSFKNWEVEDQKTGKRNAGLDDLKSLSHLSVLEMHIPHVKLCPKDLLFGNLIKFKISIGSDFQDYEQRSINPFPRTLKLKLDQSITLYSELNMLLKRAECLILEEMEDLEKVLFDSNKEGFSSLKWLKVNQCHGYEYLINTMGWMPHSVFPILEYLELNEMHNLKEIFHLPVGFFNELRKDSAGYGCLKNLRTVKVISCDKLKNLFSQYTARDLGVVLHEMSVFNCGSLEEIFANDEEASSSMGEIVFQNLNSLKLEDLPNLITFYPQQDRDSWSSDASTHPPLFNRKVVFPTLENLSLCHLDKVREIWHRQLFTENLQNLKWVNIDNCSGLKNLFPRSASKGLIQLQQLTIKSCKIMKDIVANERGEEEKEATHDVIVFPQLRTLNLTELPELISVYQGINYSSETLTIEGKMEQQGNLGAITQPPLFNEKVLFPLLEELTLSGLNKVKEIWHRQLAPENFCRLRVLKVKDCHNLITIIPSNLRQWLQNLEELYVEDCDLVEEVCEFEGLVVVDQEHEIATLPKIRELTLRTLPRLMNMWWNRGPHGFLSLQNLTSLNIFKCNELRNIFSPSASKGLVQLQKLEIDSCQMIEEIVATKREEEEEAINTIVFSKLRTLLLKNLPEFVGIYTLKWPSLEELTIASCPKMRTFPSSKYLDMKEVKARDGQFEGKMDEEGNLVGTTQVPPFFSKKVLLPTLKELRIYGQESLKEIWPNQFPADQSFSQLRVLDVKRCDKLLTVVPSNLLRRLPNLEELSVKECESVEANNVLLSQLRKLTLHNLPKLVEMWWNKDCNGILNYPNLSSLEIGGCDSLRNIFLPSVAKGFVHLEVLRIFNCLNMEEVVAKEEQGQDSGEKLVFPTVWNIGLQNLPNLRSFYSGNLTLEWPSLNTLGLMDCPNMHTFSSGLLITPKLCSVYVDRKRLWKCDLNSTIQHVLN